MMGRLMRGLLVGGLLYAGGRYLLARPRGRGRRAARWAMPIRQAGTFLLGGRPTRWKVAMDAGRAALGGMVRMLGRD